MSRILIAGLRGGGGKTIVAAGLAAAWRKQGKRVAPFKKGPDYIDAAWLAEAAGRPCRNLDLFLVKKHVLLQSFYEGSMASDAVVIEGNRGLFDGMDPEGTYSTAELAKVLQAPVILVVDATKSTRTLAALVLGCQKMDPEVPIRAVILNRVAGRRHESVIREAVSQACGLPVVGVLPKLSLQLPERHLGLVPPDEHDQVSQAIEELAVAVEKHVDLEAVWKLAAGAPESRAGIAATRTVQPPSVRVGVFRDAAFQFYYPENL
jgi:cobyrinic acid a,c-diamide synthase